MIVFCDSFSQPLALPGTALLFYAYHVIQYLNCNVNYKAFCSTVMVQWADMCIYVAIPVT